MQSELAISSHHPQAIITTVMARCSVHVVFQTLSSIGILP